MNKELTPDILATWQSEIDPRVDIGDALRPLRGRRLDALLRETRTVIHDTHVPETLIEMWGNVRYRVAGDGSYRKV